MSDLLPTKHIWCIIDSIVIEGYKFVFIRDFIQSSLQDFLF